MSLLDVFIRKRKSENGNSSVIENTYEYCSRCDANLTLQKGYSNELPYWSCRGCGEMLINPEIDVEDDISWICDGCGCMLNIQDEFSSDCGKWKCTKCGFVNKIDESEMYLSEEEFQQSLHNPYKGLSDAEVLELSIYEEIDTIGGRSDIILVKNRENEELYVKKILKDYDLSVYRHLQENSVAFMPRLVGLFEGNNNLVIVEEYIEGRSLSEILSDECLSIECAIDIAKCLCKILIDLHGKKIIHRDIKPSNIIIGNDGKTYLLDISVAKWYRPEEVEDTKLYGTLYYAAPEQFGYGFSASSEKTDIYAVGILLNVMITGKLPKEEKVTGAVWNIIEKCISLEPEKRYSSAELIDALERIG